MKHLALISTCLLTACQPKPVENIASIVDKATPLIQSNEIISEAQVEILSEAKMTALLDIIKTNKLSLSNDCSRNGKRVGLFSGHFNVGDIRCKTNGIKVFMGSSEIEFKLKDCRKNDKTQDNTTYVLGVISENKLQIINKNEEGRPLYVCN